MDRSLVYYGKTIPSSCGVLLMASGCANGVSSPMHNYLTTDVFNYQSIIEDRRKWFCTYPYGIEALHVGAGVLRIDEQKLSSREVSFCGIHDFAVFIENELSKGPFILGPVINSYLWNTVESRYFNGCAQFVYVAGKTGEQYIVYDPKGHPNLAVSINSFWKIVEDTGLTFAFRIIPAHLPPRDSRDMYLDILKRVIANRITLKNAQNNYLRCMQRLLARFKEERIKSSESLCLRYAALHISRSLYLLKEFIQYGNVPDAYGGGLYSLLNALRLLLDSYIKEYARVYTEQGFDSYEAIKKIFLLQELYEKELDGLIVDMSNIK